MCLHRGELGELESYNSSQEKKVMGPGQGFYDGQGIANAVAWMGSGSHYQLIADGGGGYCC